MLHRVKVFFYGSYMNFKVLGEVNIAEREFETVSLRGYRLTIQPLANLIADPDGIVYGIVTALDHAELDRLYSEHAKVKLGGTYLPEAVMVRDLNGRDYPAMTYISHDLAPAPADPAYVGRIHDPGKAYGFPQWFLDHIRSFA